MAIGLNYIINIKKVKKSLKISCNLIFFSYTVDNQVRKTSCNPA